MNLQKFSGYTIWSLVCYKKVIQVSENSAANCSRKKKLGCVSCYSPKLSLVGETQIHIIQLIQSCCLHFSFLLLVAELAMAELFFWTWGVWSDFFGGVGGGTCLSLMPRIWLTRSIRNASWSKPVFLESSSMSGWSFLCASSTKLLTVAMPILWKILPPSCAFHQNIVRSNKLIRLINTKHAVVILMYQEQLRDGNRISNAPLIIGECCMLNNICEHFGGAIPQQWINEAHRFSLFTFHVAVTCLFAVCAVLIKLTARLCCSARQFSAR